MEFLFGFITAWIVIRLLDAAAIIRRAKRIDKVLDEKIKEIKEKIIPSRIEEANGCLFMYNSETNEFLCQGKDMNELEQNARAKFPNKLFNVPQDELNKFLKGNNA